MDENNLENVIDVEDMHDENINISDVIEVIATDPDFNQSTMFNGGGEILQQTAPQVVLPRNQARVEIIEQPAEKALRFRYQCEGRSAGSIPGKFSTPENKSFPSIQVVGYQGRAVVVVSCVTKDAPYRAHPHNLVGREGCKKGVCTLEIPPETMKVQFSNLGIQCVKKKDIEDALKTREQIRVDPFKMGFGHRNQPTSIDLNAVRLCFQVFLEGEQRGKYTVALPPVVSDPIYDKKAMCDLVIVKLSDCVSYVDGGRKDIILLCEKVTKEDIQIRFYEEKDDQVVWEGFGDFQPSQVHKQTAIWFRAPRYKTLDVTEPVKVFIQLRRPSDGATSEPLPFELLPLDSDPGALKRKKQKFDSDQSHILRNLREHEKIRNVQPSYNIVNIPMDTMKIEPRDTTPSPYAMHHSPQYRLPMEQDQAQYEAQINFPFPSTSQQTTSVNPLNVMPLPTIDVLNQNWNIQEVMAATAVAPNDLQGGRGVNVSASGLSSVLDLDSQEMINLNSAELATLNMFDTNNLSETFTNNLSLTDINNTIDNICQLNDIYKQSPQ